jgi:Formate-dependent nitrite reductase, periplasmic cytochrome c552 subunit
MDQEKDQKGNDKELPKFDWAKFQRDRFTYKWQFFSKKHQHHFEYSEDRLYRKGAIMDSEKQTECIEVQLYKSPEKPPWDFHIRYSNWQLALRVEFFKEVFDERAFVEGYQPQHKYVRLIIPPAIHHEILNVINDFELLHIRDLILELIATAQDIYIRDVAFWERPENQKLITSAEKETQKAIQIIKQARIDWKSLDQYDRKPIPKLDHIKFVFNTGTIKLEHEWLAGEFIENMKRAYDDLHYKDWEKDLARYPVRFEENAHKSKFKYRLAKSYYNLLTKTKSIEVTEDALYPNKLMLGIAKLIEFSLIPVGDWADSDDVKVKHIRNWLKRNDLKPKLTFAEVPADLEKLKEYFEPNFLEMANSTKRVDAISVAFFICNRFDIPDLLPELIHIASCIKEPIGLLVTR